MRQLWAFIDKKEKGRPLTVGLAAATCTAIAAVFITWSLVDFFAEQLPYLLGIAAVAFSAFQFGGAAGLLAEVIALGGVSIFAPLEAPAASTRSTLVVGLFCTGLCIAGEAIQRARARERALATTAARRERTLQSMFDTSPAPTLVVDHRNCIIASNSAASSLFGKGRDDLLGHRLREYLPGYHDVDQALSIERGDGRALQLYISCAPLPIDGGELRTIYLRDDTATVAAAETLAMTQRELYQISRATSLGQLGSSIAHELNQPLAFAANYAGTAKAMATHADVDLRRLRAVLDDVLKQIFRTADVLKRLRLFIARRPPALAWIDARELVAEAMRLATLAAKQHHMMLVEPNGVPAGQVLADAVQVQQILLNLVTNAADAMHGASRCIAAIRVLPLDADTIVVTVEDAGPGLAEADLENVFKPFQSSKPDGVGIGLAICRTIVEAHGGRIWCDNKSMFGGARFLFSLKFKSLEARSDGQ